jgi:hypothetical protein
MLGLSLVLGSVAVAVSQEAPKKEEGEKKKGEEQKKEFR